jgi:hypothetical protein
MGYSNIPTNAGNAKIGSRGMVMYPQMKSGVEAHLVYGMLLAKTCFLIWEIGP